MSRRRLIMMKKNTLPYDAEVEYIASSGNQYIDTGITGTELTNFIVDINVSSSAGSSAILAAREGDPDAYDISKFSLSAFVNNAGGTAMNDRSYDSGWKNTSIINNRVKVSENHRTLFVDNTQIVYSTTEVANTFIMSTTYGLLRLHAEGWATGDTRPISANIYGSVINNGNTALRRYIPVRCGQVGYLYDTISGELFGSVTNDAFSVGNDIVSITATFSTGKTIYTCDSLDYIKKFLTVTAHYSDNSTSVLTSECCTLRGSLSVGNNVLDVEYGKHKTTVSITGVVAGVFSFYHYDFRYAAVGGAYPYYSTSNNRNKRFSYLQFDKRTSGGKTYRCIADTNTGTAYFGYQWYTEYCLELIENNSDLSGHIYDPGWKGQDVTLTIPQQYDSSDIVGLRLTCKYNQSAGNFNNGFYLERLVILEVTQ